MCAVVYARTFFFFACLQIVALLFFKPVNYNVDYKRLDIKRLLF